MNELSTDLIPAIPKEIRASRIGSCMNTFTRTFIPFTPTFDPSKLSGARLLRFVDGQGRFLCQANSSSSAFSDRSFFGLDSNVEAAAWGCKASIGYKMSKATQSATTEQGINCFVSYVYQGQTMELLYGEPVTYYNCMMEDFQKSYDKIMSAESIDDYINNYNEFIKKYGHGCVTRLYLTSGSAFRITISYNSKEESNSDKYGVSAAVNTPVGGGSVASEWGNERGKANKDANLEVIGITMPQNSPTLQWCRDMMDKFANIGINNLADKANAPSPPTGIEVKAPSIPELKKPDEKKIPKPNEKVNNGDIEKSLIKQLMFEDKYMENEIGDPEKYTDDDINNYKKDQDNRIKDLNAKKVVDEAKDVVDEAKKASKSEIKSTLIIKDEPKAQLRQSRPATLSETGSLGGEDVWDLGGYIPFAYEITPWEILFPDLKFKLPLSFTSINIAKIFIFYLTRLEFAQYLFFLNDVGSRLCDNDQIKFDAIKFADYCNDFLAEILKTLEADNFSQEAYENLVGKFEDGLDSISGRTFFSKKVYERFFNEYEDLFAESPYGFICVHDQKDYLKSNGEKASIPKPFGVASILEYANRAYPIITIEGELKLAIFDNKRKVEYFSEKDWIYRDENERGWQHLDFIKKDKDDELYKSYTEQMNKDFENFRPKKEGGGYEQKEGYEFTAIRDKCCYYKEIEGECGCRVAVYKIFDINKNKKNVFPGNTANIYILEPMQGPLEYQRYSLENGRSAYLWALSEQPYDFKQPNNKKKKDWAPESWPPEWEWKFYGVGFEDIPKSWGNETSKVLGMPMFQKFPYENLANLSSDT